MKNTVYCYPVEISGIQHMVKLDRSDKIFAVYVDDVQMATHQRRISGNYAFFQIPFEVDGTACGFILRNNDAVPRLVVKDQYLNCKIRYGSPPDPVPLIGWIMFWIGVSLSVVGTVLAICLNPLTYAAPLALISALFSHFSIFLAGSPLTTNKKTNPKRYLAQRIYVWLVSIAIWLLGVSITCMGCYLFLQQG